MKKRKKKIITEYQSQLVFDSVFEFLQQKKDFWQFCYFKRLEQTWSKSNGNVCFIYTLVYLY